MRRTRYAMRRALRALSLLLAVGIGATGLVAPARAQAAAGTVARRVLNQPDGYLLPGVAVTLTAADGAERRVVTDEQGRYRIDRLVPGRYDLIAAMPGFAATARSIEIRADASELVLDIAMDYACIEGELSRVFMPLEFTLRRSELVAHVRIRSEGELRSWPSRPTCLYMAREYLASVETIAHGTAREFPPSALRILLDDQVRLSPGSEALVFLSWSIPAQRFVLSLGEAIVRFRDGRLASHVSTFEELNGLTADEATRVIRHVANLPETTASPSVGFDDLTVPAGRQLPGCALHGQPWRGTQPAEIRQVFERLFPPSAADPAAGSFPDSSAVTEAYAAKYGLVDGRETEVVALRFRDAQQAEDRWPPRHLTGFGAIKVDTLIAGVLGQPSPCLPVLAAHLRALNP